MSQPWEQGLCPMRIFLLEECGEGDILGNQVEGVCHPALLGTLHRVTLRKSKV